MSNLDKISIFFGFQLLLVVALVGGFWIGQGFSGFKNKIPKDFLDEHRNRLGWYPTIPAAGFVIFSDVVIYFREIHWLSTVADWCFVLLCASYLVRAILTLKFQKNLPRRLNHLVVFELCCSLAGIVASSVRVFLGSS